MMKIIDDLKITPKSVKFVLCLLVVGIISIVTIRGVVDMNNVEKIKELNTEIAKSKGKLEEATKERLKSDSLATAYINRYNEKQTNIIIEQIEKDKNDEQVIIAKLPLTDTARNLSEWVNED